MNPVRRATYRAHRPEPTAPASSFTAEVGHHRATGPVSLVIIDDTPDVRLLLRIAFGRHEEFTVVGEASDGQAGVDLVRELQPDAVLLDLAMPVMDGLQALPLLRDCAPDSVIVVLSGFEGAQMGSAAIAGGAAAYIQKGVRPEEIVDTVASCLGLDTGGLPARAVTGPAATATRAPLPPRSRGASDTTASRSRADEDPYRLLVDEGIDHALVFLDTDGAIRSWNPGAQHLFSYTPEHVVGRHVDLLYPAADAANGPRPLLREAVASGRATHSRWLVDAEGRQVWGELVVTAVRAATTDEPLGFTLSIRDHTEQRRLEEAQASLFASVSHDLRAPLTAIRAFASMLDTVGPAERSTFAERIDANAEQLERLVTSLFDYAKVRAGAISLDVEPVHLSSFAAQCVNGMGAVLGAFDVQVGDERDRCPRRPHGPASDPGQPAGQCREVLRAGHLDRRPHRRRRRSRARLGHRPGPRDRPGRSRDHLRRVRPWPPRAGRRWHRPGPGQRPGTGQVAGRLGVDRERGRGGDHGHRRTPPGLNGSTGHLRAAGIDVAGEQGARW